MELPEIACLVSSAICHMAIVIQQTVVNLKTSMDTAEICTCLEHYHGTLKHVCMFESGALKHCHMREAFVIASATTHQLQWDLCAKSDPSTK